MCVAISYVRCHCWHTYLTYLTYMYLSWVGRQWHKREPKAAKGACICFLIYLPKYIPVANSRLNWCAAVAVLYVCTYLIQTNELRRKGSKLFWYCQLAHGSSLVNRRQDYHGPNPNYLCIISPRASIHIPSHIIPTSSPP